MSLEDLTTFFATLSVEDARKHLDTYPLERVRELWEAGAFGKPVPEGLKTYLFDRITGKRAEDTE